MRRHLLERPGHQAVVRRLVWCGALAVLTGLSATGHTMTMTMTTMQQPARDARVGPPVGMGAITGTLVSDEQVPRPIRRASVIVNSDDRAITRTVVTNDTGAFVFDRLPPGRYSLAATKAAYVRTAYGAKRYDRPGTPITLAAGQQITNLILKMSRGGVITGVITDENGRPAPSIQVRVLQYRTQGGERTLAPVPGGGSPLGETTDDRGVYRLFGLPPGDYVVAATPRVVGGGEVRQMTPEEIQTVMRALQQPPAAATPGATTPGRGGQSPKPQDPDAVTVGYTPVYYPGTTSATTALAIPLGAGEERTGVDFRLQLVRTAKVRGTVITPDGVSPQSVQLMILETGQVAMPGAGFGITNIAAPGPDGKFLFTGLAPGQYTITARSGGGGGGRRGGGGAGGDVVTTFSGPVPAGRGAGGPSTALWAMVDVSVSGQNLSDITLSMQPGMTISGRLTFEGVTPAPQDVSRARVSLTPPPSSGGMMISLGTPSASIGPNGEFTITGVTPGKYGVSATISVPGSLAEWTFKSVVAKGKDVSDVPLEIGPNEDVPGVVVTFTDQTQRVSGVLQDASGRPAPDYSIVVFPADKKLWTGASRRIRTTRPATDGKFVVNGLPAGDYRIAAVTDMAPNEANDPAFLEQLVVASYAFGLKDGEKKVQDLKIAGGTL